MRRLCSLLVVLSFVSLFVLSVLLFVSEFVSVSVPVFVFAFAFVVVLSLCALHCVMVASRCHHTEGQTRVQGAQHTQGTRCRKTMPSFAHFRSLLCFALCAVLYIVYERTSLSLAVVALLVVLLLLVLAVLLFVLVFVVVSVLVVFVFAVTDFLANSEK